MRGGSANKVRILHHSDATRKKKKKKKEKLRRGEERLSDIQLPGIELADPALTLRLAPTLTCRLPAQITQSIIIKRALRGFTRSVEPALAFVAALLAFSSFSFSFFHLSRRVGAERKSLTLNSISLSRACICFSSLRPTLKGAF